MSDQTAAYRDLLALADEATKLAERSQERMNAINAQYDAARDAFDKAYKSGKPTDALAREYTRCSAELLDGLTKHHALVVAATKALKAANAMAPTDFGGT